MQHFRKRLYKTIASLEHQDVYSHIYDFFMMAVILLGMAPLAFKSAPHMLEVLEPAVVIIFIVDYILRWIVADYKLKDHRPIAFLKYPFTPMAIVDLLSILPGINLISHNFKLFKMFKLFKTLRVLRIFNFVRHSENFLIMIEVLKKERRTLGCLFGMAAGYLVISSLVIFNVEPDVFPSFFDALYWSAASLTSIGYGDIHPITTVGRLVSMLSSLIGILVMAMPIGIITAGYLHVLSEKKPIQIAEPEEIVTHTEHGDGASL